MKLLLILTAFANIKCDTAVTINMFGAGLFDIFNNISEEDFSNKNEHDPINNPFNGGLKGCLARFGLLRQDNWEAGIILGSLSFNERYRSFIDKENKSMGKLLFQNGLTPLGGFYLQKTIQDLFIISVFVSITKNEEYLINYSEESNNFLSSNTHFEGEKVRTTGKLPKKNLGLGILPGIMIEIIFNEDLTFFGIAGSNITANQDYIPKKGILDHPFTLNGVTPFIGFGFSWKARS